MEMLLIEITAAEFRSGTSGTTTGVEKAMVVYSSSMSTREKSHSWQGALSLFHQMRRRRLHPDVIGYVATLSACEKHCVHVESAIYMHFCAGIHD